MHEYPRRALELMDGLAEELGIWLYPNLRLITAPTAWSRSRPGMRPPSLCGCNDLKQPANYHWPNDISAHVDFGTVADAVRLTEAAIRRLEESWL